MTFISARAAVAIAALMTMASPCFAQSAPSAAEQAHPGWRTPAGQPDLQGIWTNATVTPLERPAELAGKEFFTPSEASDYEKRIVQQNNADRRNRGAEEDLAIGYNDVWWERGTKVVASRRTSLVVEPRDGRVPTLLPKAQRRVAARAEARALHPADGPEDRSLDDRCIVRRTAGPPMLPAGYNNNYQIVQSPDHVAIIVEMIHDTRLISLDGRSHLGSRIRNLTGDSRGRWEGETLVVETTNFTDKTSLRGSGEHLRVVERFTRVDADVLRYQFSVEDPESFTRPWSGELTMRRIDGPVLEYACHEGNTSMENILGIARDEEDASRKAAGGGHRE